jgi:hypothetical protein
MTALHNVLAFNGPMPATHALPAFTVKVPGVLKNMALFLASPFIGLAYAVLLPFVGFGMLLWVATEGLRKPGHAAAAAAVQQAVEAALPPEVEAAPLQAAAEEAERQGLAGVAMLALKLLAAPFAGLAFVVAMPLVALGALAWLGMKAAYLRTA